MFSDRFYFTLGFIFPLFATFGICQYTWSRHDNVFVKLLDKHNNTKVINFNLFLLLIWILFHIFQITRFYLKNDLNAVVFLVACIMVLFIGAISAFLLIISGDDFFSVVNSVMIFMERIKGT